MSTRTESAHEVESSPGNWRAGTLAGIAGGIAMGVLVIAMNTPTIAVAIPSLYTLAPPPDPGVGMVVHVSHGAVLGVVFAGIAGVLDLDSDAKVVGVGVGWGVLTWAVLAALVMPIWLGAVGSPASPPFPNFAPPSLLWHVVYGLVLGGVYVAIDDRI